MRYLAAFVALSGLVLVAAPRSAVAADETTEAREHFEKGKAYMDLGKYNEAAAEYEAAYAAKPDPTLLLNLAQAYRQAGNAEKALRFYRKYLQYVPKTPYRADIEEKIAALDKQVKSGEGTTPAAPPPATGARTEPASGAGSVQPPYNNPPPPPPPQMGGGYGYGQPAPGGGPAPGGYPMAVAPANPGPGATAGASDPGRSFKIAGIAVGGVSVLSFVAAAIFGAQAKDAAKKIEDAAALGGIYNADLQKQDSQGRSAQSREIVSIVVGVVAVAGGGVLYYLGTRKSREAAATPGSVALLPTASTTDVGAALRVTF